MAVPIIDNLILGTDLPLDARYVVDSYYDVSMYWYDGMLIYKESTNQLWIVKDTSVEIIVEILDSSSAQIASIDGSISDLYVDQAAQDVSIQWLVDNTHTRTYIDGSLNLKVDQTLFDSSVSYLTNWNLSQDTSIVNLRGRIDVVDGSITYLTDWNNTQDSSIISLRNEDIRLDGSITSLIAEDVRIDGSLNILFQENDIQDASIVDLRNEDIRQDGSITLLFQENDIQDASIVDLRNRINVIDGSVTYLTD